MTFSEALSSFYLSDELLKVKLDSQVPCLFSNYATRRRGENGKLPVLGS